MRNLAYLDRETDSARAWCWCLDVSAQFVEDMLLGRRESMSVRPEKMQPLLNVLSSVLQSCIPPSLNPATF